MPAAVRVGDIVTGYCDGPGHETQRQFTGVWTTGSETMTADGIPVVRVGDIGVTDCNHTFFAATGADTSTADGKPLHRVGDVVLVNEGGVGVSVTGSETATAE